MGDVSVQINALFVNNELDDLVRFMARRKCLNTCNARLAYVFNFLQSAGIMTTTVAAGYNIKALVWAGIGLNVLASLVAAYEQTNNTMSARLLKDITAIKSGKYIDEGVIVDPTTDNKPPSPTTAPQPMEMSP